MSQTSNPIQSAQRTIRLELEAIQTLLQRINGDFVRACELILACKGRVVVVGMGKSGHIGRKIAATLASTGTAAFFVHPGEASHGDMGMITRDDVVLALSNSGTTSEIVTLLPLIKRLGITLISMTGNPDSPLARAAAVNLDAGVSQEACPLNLAPTSSTTVTLVLGDALAVALLEARGFTAEDFAISHPSGTLGRRLLLQVGDVMHKGDRVPRVTRETTLLNALSEISAKGFGMTIVVDDTDTIIGIFTDGDLRRALDRGEDVRSVMIGEVMTHSPLTSRPDTLAAEALTVMENHKITAIVVANEKNQPVGVLHMHDLLSAGLA